MLTAHVKDGVATIILFGSVPDNAIDMACLMDGFISALKKRGVTNTQAQIIIRQITTAVLCQPENQTLDDFLQQIIKGS